MPDKVHAVGYQTHCPGTPWYGEHFIGICNHSETVQVPGKVKDGLLCYGYGGKEHYTKEF
jgi:hypothetical protein